MRPARIIPAASVKVELEDVTLDLLCFDYLNSVLRDRRAAGRMRGYVEVVLAANPGLADEGLILPRGLVVTLPEFTVRTPAAKLRLWS